MLRLPAGAARATRALATATYLRTYPLPATHTHTLSRTLTHTSLTHTGALPAAVHFVSYAPLAAKQRRGMASRTPEPHQHEQTSHPAAAAAGAATVPTHTHTRAHTAAGKPTHHAGTCTRVCAARLCAGVAEAVLHPRTSCAAPRADDGTFFNPWQSYTEFGPTDFLFRVVPELRATKTYALPVVPVDWAAVANPVDKVQATWIGHASFLVQAHGYNFLTDPVFSNRASPVQFAGPARYTPPACAVKDLPPVHVVLISHNHYDHIDSGSIAALLEKQRTDLEQAKRGTAPAGRHAPYTGTLFVCPLRVKPLLVSLGVQAHMIAELDWWQSFTPAAHSTGGIVPEAAAGAVAAIPRSGDLPTMPAGLPRIHCVPAQHQSARTLWDRNKTLWCGYHVAVTGGAASTPSSFFFSGDTGYRNVPKGVAPLSAEEAALPRCPAFAEIGARFGEVDLALLPIGAYSPRWFMSSFHASPEDAVDMHIDVRSRRSIGMHWGTFPLTDEPIEEPPERLAAALRARGVACDAFVAVRAGATVGTTRGALRPQIELVDVSATAGAAASSTPTSSRTQGIAPVAAAAAAPTA